MTLDVQVCAQVGGFEVTARLHAGSGDVVAVLGPNGAGKTTLLRAVAGLLRPSGGRVTLAGRVLDDVASGVHVPVEERRLGVVFQDYLLFPHRSALGNVAFGLRAAGLPRATARADARRWLDRVGLGGDADRRPAGLSGGQQQRVALARALAVQPDLLLLDEPLAALDVETRHDLRRRLRRHLAAFAGPCVLVTHDPLDAAVLATRLVILEGGRVTQEGTVADVTRRPRSAWVARLVGVNLLGGRAAGDRVMLAGGATLAVADRVEGDVLALIRPQAVALHRQRPEGSPRNVWRVRVGGLEPAGERVRAHLDGPVPLTAEVTPAAVSALDLGGGGPLWASVKATEVEVYPA